MLTTVLQNVDYEWIWLIIFIVAFLFEVTTVGLVSIWFAAGALFALAAAALGLDLWAQLLIFIVVSLVSLFTIGRWAKKKIVKNNTNVDSLEGKDVVVLKDADYLNLGEGKINGVIWSITCKEGTKVLEGEIAIIVGIDGNRLIVEHKKREEK